MKNLKMGINQLFWLEEIHQNYWIEVQLQAKGDSVFNPNLIQMRQMVKLGELAKFKHKYPEENIWRSWTVFQDQERRNPLGFVPLVFDIDNESDPVQIKHAYKITLTCLNILETQYDWIDSRDRLRVVFSGRRGFHIEIKPAAPIDVEQIRNELLILCEEAGLARFANTFCENDTTTVVDPLSHEWLRLTDTKYSWFSHDGSLQVRSIFQLSTDEFRRFGPDRILAIATKEHTCQK